MTESMFNAVLSKAGCEQDKDGVARLPMGRTMTLYVAHHGTQLSVSKVVAVRRNPSGGDGGLLETEDAKGETFLLSLDDVFAASVSGASKAAGGRKAGFLG